MQHGIFVDRAAEFNIIEEFRYVNITCHIPELRNAHHFFAAAAIHVCNQVSRHFISIEVSEGGMKEIVGNYIGPMLRRKTDALIYCDCAIRAAKAIRILSHGRTILVMDPPEKGAKERMQQYELETFLQIFFIDFLLCLFFLFF